MLNLSDVEDDPDPAVFAALPDAEELHLQLPTLDRYSQGSRLPMTALTVGYVDDAALRLLARAPRLRTLDIKRLAATDLAPIADHPELCALGFDTALRLRSLDQVPTAVFLGDRNPPRRPNELVLTNNPLASIRQLVHLRGVEHLDLSGCTELTSLGGLEGMDALRTVLADKQGPLELFPPSLWSRVDWSKRRMRSY
ncbi:leucine-rich repeat domain-containing protein [Corallococcus llansteffanensis]|uniref:Leucine-rich repeat domain-containing protein n=1 Tax=Corallococcus llansteffanensis TaxID=2316731 RepID=A0A3A8PV94_9BACT|nr:leucine-rich repeat domain-containing protein [Corallococcus llansteffanensis]RKH55404.1 hypothetical protein D7V93_23010 [Corallococcus llansteffanensis]